MTQHNHSPGINTVNEDMRSLLRSVDRQVRRGVFDVSVKQDNSRSDKVAHYDPGSASIQGKPVNNRNTSLNGIKTLKKRPDLPKQSKSQVLKRTHSKKSFTAIHPNKHHIPLRYFIYFGMTVMLMIAFTVTVLFIYSRAGKTQTPSEINRNKSDRILILENSFY